MIRKHNFSLVGLISAGVVSGGLSAALVLAAAAIGWLFQQPLLAGILAMVVSSILLIGFGGTKLWALIVVGISWATGDYIFSQLGMTGTTASVIMAVSYLLLGFTQGQTRSEVVMAGAGPIVGAVLGIIFLAVLVPTAVTQGIEEAVLSASMIAAGRTVRAYWVGSV